MDRVDLRRLPADWSSEEEQLLQAIDDATATPVDIDRRLAEEWFAGIGWVLDDLEDLAAQRATIALELIEHLLLRLEAALPSVDDSDGGTVVVLDRLLGLHRRVAAGRSVARLRELGDLELLA